MKADFRTILFATDFLQNSRLALDYAVLLGKKLSARLVIVNAFEMSPEAQTVEAVENIPSRTRRLAQARLDAFVAGVDRAGVPAQSALVEGPVPDAILKCAEQVNADLLVFGTQGIHRGLEHLLIGSNTEALMVRSTCPTLTIGPHVLAGIDPDGCFRKVIYISNLRPAAAEAAPLALRLSQLLASEIAVYQVVRNAEEKKLSGQLQALIEEYCTRLRTFLPAVSERWCDPEFQKGRLITPQEVLTKSQDSSALMVLGVPGMAALERHLRTSYPYRLLANAACPILTVRS